MELHKDDASIAERRQFDDRVNLSWAVALRKALCAQTPELADVLSGNLAGESLNGCGYAEESPRYLGGDAGSQPGGELITGISLPS